MRYTTLITLHGGGEQGVGEDVVYDGLDHASFQAAGPTLPLAGSWTLGSFAERLSELDAFPDPPVRDVSRRYRSWAFESAALDLALRQAGRSLADHLGHELRPLAYVVSRCGSRFFRQRRAGDLREDAARPRALPGHALQARPDQHLERRADRRAGGHGRGRLARPQGPVQGHAGRRRDRSGAVRQAGRGVPGRLARGPRHQRRDAPDPRAAARPGHLGRADPLGRRRARRSSGSRAPSTSSRRASARWRSSAAPTTSAPSAASAPTAAARPSSAWAATTSSTWPRCSTRTRPTTSPRAASTSRGCPTGCPRARSRSSRPHRLPLRVIEAHPLHPGGQTALELAGEWPRFLGEAARSLDLALYDVRLPGEPGDVVSGALRDAADRGVAVRIAYNADHDERDLPAAAAHRAGADRGAAVPDLRHPRHPGPDAPQVRRARRRSRSGPARPTGRPTRGRSRRT